MITTREAADRLGLTPTSIRRLCREGHIRGARRLGRDWAIPPASLAEISRYQHRNRPKSNGH